MRTVFIGSVCKRCSDPVERYGPSDSHCFCTRCHNTRIHCVKLAREDHPDFSPSCPEEALWPYIHAACQARGLDTPYGFRPGEQWGPKNE